MKVVRGIGYTVLVGWLLLLAAYSSGVVAIEGQSFMLWSSLLSGVSLVLIALAERWGRRSQ